ncbi:hypothetical protein HID58_036408 [Brassica napus]|uniref:Uncharacterized protein n=1 Tax=Brassica napus TaxID=3708 RepID=A0ABQ8C8H7_BRANA|nr:hypothetical protein HID58_036408 [Brassica napus]
MPLLDLKPMEHLRGKDVVVCTPPPRLPVQRIMVTPASAPFQVYALAVNSDGRYLTTRGVDRHVHKVDKAEKLDGGEGGKRGESLVARTKQPTVF